MGMLLKNLARFFALIGFLIILAPLSSVAADVAPAEDRGWGVEDYETENARYLARVQFYKDQLEMLEGRRQQINADMNLFWHSWDQEVRDAYVDEFDRTREGMLTWDRVNMREGDMNAARGLFEDFEINCARCDPRKPDIREREAQMRMARRKAKL